MNIDNKIFVMNMAIKEQENISKYSKVKVRVQIFDKITTIVQTKYSNYSNIFSTKNIIEFLEHFGINNHVIKLEKCKQPSFRFIYSLRSIKLKMLKTYIKTNLANGFIYSLKSSVRSLIFFN